MIISITVCAGCGDMDAPRAPAPTIASGIFAPLGEPLPSATAEQLDAFGRGLDLVTVRATPEGGLGPRFNAVSCGACHEKPILGGGAARYRDFSLAGRQLPDGTIARGESLVQPQYTLEAEGRARTTEGTVLVATRHAIPLFGAGLLAEIPEDEILGRADPNDEDHDGISGRAAVDSGFVGRFGRKAQLASLETFLRSELGDHVGLTSDPLPEERHGSLPVREAAPEAFGIVDADTVDDPELPAEDLFDLVSFTMLLAAPEPDPPTADDLAGSELFARVGCAGCHVPALAGPRGLIPAYTDLLLHDMGADLADGVEIGVATGSELRTQPLWGIAAAGPYLHDGRADTLEEAVNAHGGEGAHARDAFAALGEEDRARLIGFLESLGGKDRPSVRPPAAGELGGPADALAGDELERFERGRAAFDRDASIAEGLGAGFNGDSCRACHSDPVIGGSGAADVDVTRQAVADPKTGEVAIPPGGSMLHRHAQGGPRPAAYPSANLFELRQTPPLFGLGLVERVPEAEILSREDPADADGDGISGRAHRLPDGRLGRFGWKANVPTLAEFARDAMLGELGITLPPEDGQTFGASSDTDAAPDPELPIDEVTDLVFFMRALAPPPRSSTDRAAEARGEIAFGALGCGGCHVVLHTEQRTPVRLYSDLLLHDVGPPGAAGIPGGAASGRELRTPPLWGLSRSAPYMHDGRSFTLGDAILRHDSEALAARHAYVELGDADRADLDAFLGSL